MRGTLRVFNKGNQVFKIIYEVVRLKIMSFKLKSNPRTRQAIQRWNIGAYELTES